MRAVTALPCIGILALVLVTPLRAAKPEPADWVPHAVIVQYENLPRAYGCDALWYKVGDILRALGAWKAVSITPYACAATGRSGGRSPQLEIHFLTLRRLDAADARWAQARAVPTTIDLRPGTPKSLTAADCELLRQTEQGVLPLLASMRVLTPHFACPVANGPFSFSVQALVPASGSAPASR